MLSMLCKTDEYTHLSPRLCAQVNTHVKKTEPYKSLERKLHWQLPLF